MYSNNDLPAGTTGDEMYEEYLAGHDAPGGSLPGQINDVHYNGGLFARIPHEFLKDVKDPVAIAVYNHLMRYADWNSGLAHPTRESLAKAMDYKTTRPVDNAIKLLVEKGWIKTFPRWKKYVPDTKRTYVSHEYQKGWSQDANGYVVYDKKQVFEGSTGGNARGAQQSAHRGDCGTPAGVTTGHTNKNHLNKNHLTNKKHMLISSETSESVSKKSDDAQPEKTTGDSSSKKKPAEKYPAEFLEWYGIYPRKKAKGDALKAYRAAVKEIDHSELMEKTRKYVRYVEQSEPAMRFVPYPATWLRAARWDDELEPPEALNRAETGHRAPGTPSPRDKSAEQLMAELWAREDAQANNPNHQPQTAPLGWPYGSQKELG